MKKKAGLIALTSISLFSLMSVVLSTYSWFVASVQTPEYNLKGQSAGAYFAYGDGLPYEVDDEGKVIHRPYGISIPRHLYNLAWLQYMGEFADGQYYFEIAESVSEDGLDMSEYILPPIGTKDNPFVSNFNGNGKVINNLTITNDENAIFNSYKHPDQTQVNYEAPEIVGLFGVVGNYKNVYSGTYDSSINSISNLGLNNVKVESTTAKALAGLVAGYVNASVEDIAVQGGTIKINKPGVTAVDSANLTPNVSDYTIVGYCESQYKANVKQASNNVYGIDVANNEFVVNDEGTEAGLGGSINMTDLYNRIYKASGAANGTNARYRTNSVVRLEKLYETDKVNSTTTNTITVTSGAWIKNDNNEIGNYSVGYYSNRNYMCLIGGHYEQATYKEEYEHIGVKIGDGNGHFLTSTNVANNANVTQNTTEDNAIVWIIETGNTPRIYTQYNNNPLYLYRYNDTTLRFTNSATTATRWNKETDPTTGGIRYTSNGRMIAYTNNAWGLVAAPAMPTYPTAPVAPYAEPQFNLTPPPVVADPGQRPADAPAVVTWNNQLYFNDNGTFRFLAPPANNDADGSIASSDTPLNGGWTRTADGTYYTFRMTNNNSYYLRSRTGNNTYRLNLSNATGNNASQYRRFAQTDGGDNDNNTFFYHYNNRYLRYDNGNFSINTAQNTTTNSSMYFETIYEYDGTYYRTQNAANAARQAAVDVITPKQQEWDNLNSAYQAYLAEKQAYDQAEAQWQAEHDQWEADNTYRDVTYPALVNQYNADLETYHNSHYIATVDVTADNPVYGPDYRALDYPEKTGMVYEASDTSYFPINVVKDGNQTDLNNYKPKNTNTGYIVGGSRESMMRTGGTNTDLSDASSTRVSKYTISNISSSYSDGTLGNVYTVNANNQIQQIGQNYYNGYQEFDKAKEKLATMLQKDNSYVYGLHYVEAEVSIENKMTANYALVNGKTYNANDKYELPVNCIDFNLKEKGFINFFAGMYYPANDAMFSLHQVRRNADNTIAEIKEITEVLSDRDEAHSYVYKFSDGQYSVPFILTGTGEKKNLNGTTYNEETSLDGGTTAPTGYSTVLFDTSRITNYNGDTRINDDFWWPGANNNTPGSNSNTDKVVRDANGNNVTVNKSIYYFEIPMNVGEFALGSTSKGYGGYLFYLDIGANARKLNRTTFIERFTYSELTQEYPRGVQFVSSFVIEEGVFAVDEINSGTVAILPSYNDSLIVSRTGDNITFTGYDSDYIKGQYKDTDITLINGEDPPNEIAVVPKSVTSDTWRMQYYDYNPLTKEMYRTVITNKTEIIDGVVQPVDNHVQQYDNSNTLIYDNQDSTLSDASNIVIYNISGYKIDDYETITIARDKADNQILILNYTCNGRAVVIEEIIEELTASQITDSAYYQATGYVITITLVDGSGTMTISTTSYSGSNTSYSGESVTVNGYVITITGINVIVVQNNP